MKICSVLCALCVCGRVCAPCSVPRAPCSALRAPCSVLRASCFVLCVSCSVLCAWIKKKEVINRDVTHTTSAGRGTNIKY